MEVAMVFVIFGIIFCIKTFFLAFFESLGRGLAEKILSKHKKATPEPPKRRSG